MKSATAALFTILYLNSGTASWARCAGARGGCVGEMSPAEQEEAMRAYREARKPQADAIAREVGEAGVNALNAYLREISPNTRFDPAMAALQYSGPRRDESQEVYRELDLQQTRALIIAAGVLAGKAPVPTAADDLRSVADALSRQSDLLYPNTPKLEALARIGRKLEGQQGAVKFGILTVGNFHGDRVSLFPLSGDPPPVDPRGRGLVLSLEAPSRPPYHGRYAVVDNAGRLWTDGIGNHAHAVRRVSDNSGRLLIREILWDSEQPAQPLRRHSYRSGILTNGHL
ncbi:MAG: hypothetical protein HY078_16130 [Elusimicrobia bacterium]|nr:hypothetical protein [Elusimicrobiota bacterium]